MAALSLTAPPWRRAVLAEAAPRCMRSNAAVHDLEVMYGYTLAAVGGALRPPVHAAPAVGAALGVHFSRQGSRHVPSVIMTTVKPASTASSNQTSASPERDLVMPSAA